MMCAVGNSSVVYKDHVSHIVDSRKRWRRIMSKIADKYFKVDSWKIIEEGFNPDYGEVSESIFSLGNEYMGVRGYFEEGYNGPKLIGSYFNGIYERTKPDYGHYKGIVDFTEYMVNSVDWLYTRICVDGEELEISKSDISEFVRELDMRNGVLTRSFIWNLSNGKKLKVSFERILSMTDVQVGAQRVKLTALNFDGDVEIKSGLDFSNPHCMQRMNMWEIKDTLHKSGKNAFAGIEGETLHTQQRVFSACAIKADVNEFDTVKEEKKAVVKFNLSLKQNEEKTFEKIVKNFTLKEEKEENKFHKDVKTVYEEFETGKENDISSISFEQIKEDSTKWWKEIWETSDVTIDGDEENQQGIRFCIFQLFQTYHGAVKGTNIGAKGLTGEAYNGNAFWDTETYCLPFFLFNNKEAAQNLLYFRYKTLDEARERAKALDCEGAFYPIATISGRECCNLWQHASLQLQASTAVAYGIWFYEKLYHDEEFMTQYGLEMLIEISRMLVTRGDFSQDGKYGYYCVMGPDEFQMMVHNNCYTNFMGKFTLDFTLKVIEDIKKNDKKAYDEIVGKINFDESEMDKWKKVSECMYIPYYEDSLLYEQHEGFFKLPHLDIDSIPIEDFPLYNHWSYDRIYRNDMIKQPDVLMFMLLFNSHFTEEQLKANYEYYEPRCIHESSLSPSVHSILASQLHKKDEAYDFFGFATRMDLDNYNRNTREGIHTTSIAAAWMNIIYGFGGLRTDGDIIHITPSIPQNWNKYTFKIHYMGEVIEVMVTKDKVEISTKYGKNILVQVYDEKIELGEEAYICDVK